ncbi:MAG: BTAD domain-containing putative transcriptional regulator [Elainellaceae cyanobacterium]
MEFETALNLVNDAMVAHFDRLLNDAELTLFRGAWYHQTYDTTAEESDYSSSYLTRTVGPKFWKQLSEALGERVSKTSFRAAIEQRSRQAEPRLPPPAALVEQRSEPESFGAALVQNASHSLAIDWGEAPDVTIFYGRQSELATLKQWVEGDRCRLMGVLGMGGMGKTALVAKLIETLVESDDCPFQHIIWRSLRNAPSLQEVLADVLPFLSHQQDTEATPKRLLYWLRQARCLIVFDNMETILQEGEQAGSFRTGYEEYRDLLQVIAETRHQSSVVLTSREKPHVVGLQEGIDLPVRSLQLSGSSEAAFALINAKGLMGTDEEKQQLAQYYNHSPLALKIVSTSIQTLFDGQIRLFLNENTLVFNGLQRLLDQQFERLSGLEKTVMTWLAINREWTSTTDLAADIVPVVSRASLLETLESLGSRHLIETRSGYYTQQPVVMEYVTCRFNVQMATELIDLHFDCSHHYAILKTTVKDYVRESQSRLIVQPILQYLQESYQSTEAIRQHLQTLLELLHTETSLQSSYAAGNLMNLCCHLQVDLSHYDFSHLIIRHADLQNNSVRRLNVTDSTFISPRFFQAFSPIFQVAFSPDGTLLASGDGAGQAQIWRLADRQPIVSFKALNTWVMTVQFSPDGNLLAVGDTDGTLYLWHVHTGQLVHQFTAHSGVIWNTPFSPDGTLLATSSTDHTIKLWDVRQGILIATLQEHTKDVRSVDFNSDGTKLVSSSIDQSIIIWDISSYQPIKRMAHPTGAVLAVRFSPDDRYIATGHSDRSVGLWDTLSGECVRLLEGHVQSILSISFNSTGTLLVSGSADGTAKLWEVSSGRLVRTFQGHNNWLWSAEFSPDGLSLATGCNDQTVKLWDVSSGRLLTALQGSANWVMSVQFSPDSTLLASGNFDCTVRLWDVSTQQLSKTLYGHHSWVESVCFSPDGDRLVSSSTDCTIKLWEIQSGRCLNTLKGHSSGIWAVMFSHDGNWIASASCDMTVKLWDACTGNLIHTFDGHLSWVLCVQFNPSGTLIASGSADGTVRLWDVQTKSLWKTLRAETSWVWSVSFTPDGRYLATGSNNGTVQLWNIDNETVIHTLADHEMTVASVNIHPFKPLLASGSDDQTVGLWDINSGKLLRLLRGHQHRVAAVTFSPDGQCLASGSVDETIRLWDIATGNCLGILQSERPYEGMNITGVQGLTEAQKSTLKSLGAIEQIDPESTLEGHSAIQGYSSRVEPSQQIEAVVQLTQTPAFFTSIEETHSRSQPALQIQVLGDLQITYNDQSIDTLINERSQILLAYLLLQRHTPQPRQRVAFALYDMSDSQARTTLRKDIFNLRQALPHAERYLLTTAKTLQWNESANLSLDMAEFEAALCEVEHVSDSEMAAKQQMLERAIALYSGDLLPTLDPEWLMREREQLRQRYLSALEQLIGLLHKRQDYGVALRYAQQLLAADPLRESAYQTVMQLYRDNGDRAAAIRTYHECMTMLREELGIDPSLETQALYQQLLD